MKFIVPDQNFADLSFWRLSIVEHRGYQLQKWKYFGFHFREIATLIILSIII